MKRIFKQIDIKENINNKKKQIINVIHEFDTILNNRVTIHICAEIGCLVVVEVVNVLLPISYMVFVLIS